MNDDRIQRAASADGTALAARVVGQGPSLVLLPAGPGDCEATWAPALPALSRRFTCHLLDTRGRGLSADHPDHSPARLVEDIVSLAESVGEPVGLAEWGSFVGASWALFAAQETPVVRAVAAYDPLVIGAAEEADAARLRDVLDRVGALAAEGRLTEAGRTFVKGLARHGYYTEEDMAEGATFDFWAAAAPNIPMFFRELEQAEPPAGAESPDAADSSTSTAGGSPLHPDRGHPDRGHPDPGHPDPEHPDPGDPAALARTAVPVLLLHGARSHPMNLEFVRYVAAHVPDAEVRAVAGAGHYGPHTHPEAVAGALGEFFEEALQPA